MGIVFRQSFKNTLIIYLSFIIGGINTIIFYPNFLGKEFYGMVVFLLASSNLIMPITAFGIQHTIVKFFSSYQTKKEKDAFLSSVVFLPLLLAIPLGYFWDETHHWIMKKVGDKNPQIEEFTWSIYIIAITCAYFELFYSWTKVQLKTVFGNVLKELWNRAVVMLLLFLVFFDVINNADFILYLTIAYVLKAFVMMGYALCIYLPKFHFSLPKNYSEILRYSVYIILAGSAGAIILDIDKVMIPGKETIEKAAYYAVAVFIGSFVEAPARAMNQILQPLTSKSINEKNSKETKNLYKKSSINLLLIGGLFFLLVNCGVRELFKIMPEKGYAGGEMVVLMISLAKLYTMFLGNNSAIINNSKYYRITLPLGLGMAFSVYYLNEWLFGVYGTDGLALATLLTIFTFNSIKLGFVKRKFLMSPFTKKSFKMLLIIVVLFFAFRFWDFPIDDIYVSKLAIHPIFNILLKSIVLAFVYLFLVIQLNISEEINRLFKRYFHK